MYSEQGNTAPQSSIVEIPHGWTNAISHSSSQQYFDKIMLSGLIAGRDQTGKKADKHVSFQPRILERRAAKRASAPAMDELEESATNAEVSAEAMLIAAEAVLT